jgi:hypothetical protein
MSRRMCFRFGCALAGAVILVGCTGGRPDRPAPAASSAAPRPPPQVTMADARGTTKSTIISRGKGASTLGPTAPLAGHRGFVPEAVTMSYQPVCAHAAFLTRATEAPGTTGPHRVY